MGIQEVSSIPELLNPNLPFNNAPRSQSSVRWHPTIAQPVFPLQDLCTCYFLCLDSPLILAWLGPTHPELGCHSVRKVSLHLPIKVFSLNSPILFFHALFAVCKYVQIYCMAVSKKAEAVSP